MAAGWGNGGLYANETAKNNRWHPPAAPYLDIGGAAHGFNGAVTQHPVTPPLYDGQSPLKRRAAWRVEDAPGGGVFRDDRPLAWEPAWPLFSSDDGNVAPGMKAPIDRNQRGLPGQASGGQQAVRRVTVEIARQSGGQHGFLGGDRQQAHRRTL